MEYGYKKVVKNDEFYEGIVVERSEEGQVVAREYIKNEYGEQMQEGVIKEIDFVKVSTKKTPIGKMREIVKQIGTGKFVIDEDVIAMIE